MSYFEISTTLISKQCFTSLTSPSVFENRHLHITLVTLYKIFRRYMVDCFLIYVSSQVSSDVKVFSSLKSNFLSLL
ncbi:hypothetical protein HCUR_01343 [Holospora curviuscula]|uniref:Uncharacterized protein n=1 Tax=Holospora curviuscula TaxID=1082868 RepID=A0A2S5R7D4_9PROT|nr:hypothetical protein HCUR_01343 [Holospora curviuscula]